MVDLSFALVGFGNVGRSLICLLQQKRDVLLKQHGIRFKITGIATGHHGIAIDPGGFDLDQVLHTPDINALSKMPVPSSIIEFIQTCPANVLFENSPTNHETGQPAIDYLKTALKRGMLGITANKGPVVYGYQELSALALQHHSKFMFESAVMDGAPIFSLFREALPVAELNGFTGILNSCTNLILERMRNGETLDQAVRFAQSIGITETDPDADVDGWDAAVKVAALTTVLMNHPMTPYMVDRTGIRGISSRMIEEATAAGERWKLVCSARRSEDTVITTVRPVRVNPTSPMFAINGTSSYVQFDSDMLPGLGIIESDPGPQTTAYGLLADLINAVRGKGVIQ